MNEKDVIKINKLLQESKDLTKTKNEYITKWTIQESKEFEYDPIANAGQALKNVTSFTKASLPLSNKVQLWKHPATETYTLTPITEDISYKPIVFASDFGYSIGSSLATKTMPKQKPGKSIQEVGTPKEFIQAIAKQFTQIDVDLAANNTNKVCPDYLGPGSLFEDSLKVQWHKLNGFLFLNPPFGKIKPWVKKCHEENLLGAEIGLLVPASVGSNWFRDYVFKKAHVYFLSPRIKFVGHKHLYPKDLMFCWYSPKLINPNMTIWNWKKLQIL
jgi:hypothetical protein